jgi:hypothetical protein
MSPLAEYTRIHDLGVGLIAKRPRDWESAVRKLLHSAKGREELRARGLAIAKELTYEKNAYRWVEALNSVLATRMTYATE